MAMPPIASADGHAGSYVHSRKQGRNAMSLIVMRLSSGDARRQRQNRFGPIEGLHLALFIHAQYNCAVRRVQVQADNVPHLLHKLRVFGELEVLHAMRLQSESMPDPDDGVLR